MRIASLSLTNFRCFGPATTTVDLDDMTALIGGNGCGKSAVLIALARLFGTTDRNILRSDFHLPVGQTWDARTSATLRIEAKLEFPELVPPQPPQAGVSGPATPTAQPTATAAPAATFRHMTVQSPGQIPYCRVRLTATWTASAVAEGDIEQQFKWITSPIGTPEENEQSSPVQSHERAKIHVHYVPAIRDPARHIRQVSGSILNTLMRAVNWSSTTRTNIATASQSIQNAFGAEGGIATIQTAIRKYWQQLHTQSSIQNVTIRPVAAQLDDLIKEVETVLSPDRVSREVDVDMLSDGQRSLFYISMVAALLELQTTISTGTTGQFSIAAINLPILTVLAVEEPENHVAPHLLGRIMKVLQDAASSHHGQVLLSSHSPAILRRISPTHVRHLRLDATAQTTLVRRILLPPEADEAYTFVREAVQAHPDLYFAKCVVLGEGDSEEVVLPKVAAAMGLPLDHNLVSVVPLGGRHVNHFWRLLHQLEIPHVTLLDLDIGREGGGWGRIKGAINQLLANNVSRTALLGTTTAEQFDEMHTWSLSDSDADTTLLAGWLNHLATYNVFFAQLLDLDFSMLTAFPEAYKRLSAGEIGPRIPTEPVALARATESVTDVVLGGPGANLYDADDKSDLFWYRYLFLSRSKPTTHMKAMASIDAVSLSQRAPAYLKQVIDRLRVLVPPINTTPPQ